MKLLAVLFMIFSAKCLLATENSTNNEEGEITMNDIIDNKHVRTGKEKKTQHNRTDSNREHDTKQSDDFKIGHDVGTNESGVVVNLKSGTGKNTTVKTGALRNSTLSFDEKNAALKTTATEKTDQPSGSDSTRHTNDIVKPTTDQSNGGNMDHDRGTVENDTVKNATRNNTMSGTTSVVKNASGKTGAIEESSPVSGSMGNSTGPYNNANDDVKTNHDKQNVETDLKTSTVKSETVKEGVKSKNVSGSYDYVQNAFVRNARKASLASSVDTDSSMKPSATQNDGAKIDNDKDTVETGTNVNLGTNIRKRSAAIQNATVKNANAKKINTIGKSIPTNPNRTPKNRSLKTYPYREKHSVESDIDTSILEGEISHMKEIHTKNRNDDTIIKGDIKSLNNDASTNTNHLETGTPRNDKTDTSSRKKNGTNTNTASRGNSKSLKNSTQTVATGSTGNGKSIKNGTTNKSDTSTHVPEGEVLYSQLDRDKTGIANYETAINKDSGSKTNGTLKDTITKSVNTKNANTMDATKENYPPGPEENVSHSQKERDKTGIANHETAINKDSGSKTNGTLKDTITKNVNTKNANTMDATKENYPPGPEKNVSHFQKERDKTGIANHETAINKDSGSKTNSALKDTITKSVNTKNANTMDATKENYPPAPEENVSHSQKERDKTSIANHKTAMNKDSGSKTNSALKDTITKSVNTKNANTMDATKENYPPAPEENVSHSQKERDKTSIANHKTAMNKDSGSKTNSALKDTITKSVNTKNANTMDATNENYSPGPEKNVSHFQKERGKTGIANHETAMNKDSGSKTNSAVKDTITKSVNTKNANTMDATKENSPAKKGAIEKDLREEYTVETGMVENGTVRTDKIKEEILKINNVNGTIAKNDSCVLDCEIPDFLISLCHPLKPYIHCDKQVTDKFERFLTLNESARCPCLWRTVFQFGRIDRRQYTKMIFFTPENKTKSLRVRFSSLVRDCKNFNDGLCGSSLIEEGVTGLPKKAEAQVNDLLENAQADPLLNDLIPGATEQAKKPARDKFILWICIGTSILMLLICTYFVARISFDGERRNPGVRGSLSIPDTRFDKFMKKYGGIKQKTTEEEKTRLIDDPVLQEKLTTPKSYTADEKTVKFDKNKERNSSASGSTQSSPDVDISLKTVYSVSAENIMTKKLSKVQPASESDSEGEETRLFHSSLMYGKNPSRPKLH